MKNILIYIFILFIGCLIGIYINSHKSTKYKENININKIKNNIQPYINEESIQIDNFNKKNLLDNINNEKDANSINISKNSNNYIKISKLELFKRLLEKLEYQKALKIYENIAHTSRQKYYENILFEYIDINIEQNSYSIEKLLKLFLQIYYENPKALYYQAIIQYKKNLYLKSIKILYKTKDQYIENQNLKNQRNKTLKNYIKNYILILQNNKDTKKIIKLFKYLINQEKKYDNSHNNSNKYKHQLAKIYYDLKYYKKSKILLEDITQDYIYINEVKKTISNIEKTKKLNQKYKTKIKLQKSNNHFYINAIINNNLKIKLLIDTGASLTFINEKLFLNLDKSTLKPILLNTANGVLKSYILILDNFSIQNIGFDSFEVTIGDINGPYDGLLGMNYLKNFDFYIDQEKSILYLNPLNNI